MALPCSIFIRHTVLGIVSIELNGKVINLNTISNIIDTTLQVNEFARRNRHLKVFSGAMRWKVYLTRLMHMRWIAKPLLILNKTTASVFDIAPTSPPKKLLFQATTLSLAALFVTSFSPGGTFTVASMTYSNDYISAYSLPGDVLVSDEEGYLVKVNPQTADSNRAGLTDYAVHTVESGETLSLIASRYGVKTETVMWENNLGNANSLRIGQKLLVPPVDGVSYKVKSGDNLEKIAKKYKISVESIVAQNGLESETIGKGQSLFLPQAKPLYSTIASSRSTVGSRGAGRTYTNASPSTSVPATGKMFIFPTRGKLTQGFRGGHYALDIGDRSKPPIWAAGGGTVTKASVGTWGGGYGNHVIIDHGNGVKTLYAHMDSVSVYPGQWVNQGDVLGIMGNTGRVYGATGIHLHLEVIDNGVKRNPYNYF